MTTETNTGSGARVSSQIKNSSLETLAQLSVAAVLCPPAVMRAIAEDQDKCIKALFADRHSAPNARCMTPADLKEWRKQMNFTQDQAAIALGITKPAYGRLERGQKFIDSFFIYSPARHARLSAFVLGL